MKTVLKPNARLDLTIGRFPLSEYVSVPAISTYGVWKMRELILPDQLAELARWTNKRESDRKAGVKPFKTVKTPRHLR